MVQFYSEYNQAQSRYEQQCREASASNQSARAADRQCLEDELVEGGIKAIEEYEKLLDERWEKASGIAQYTGVSMGYAIAKRARARIEESALSDFPPLQTETFDVVTVQIEEEGDLNT